MLLKFSSFRRQIDPKKRRKTEENEEESFIQFRVCVGCYEIIVLFKNFRIVIGFGLFRTNFFILWPWNKVQMKLEKWKITSLPFSAWCPPKGHTHT